MKGKQKSAGYDAKKKFIKDEIVGKVKRYFGKTIDQATQREIYTAVSMTIRDEIMDKWVNYKEKTEKKAQKELYYLSFEFLMGRAMGNNLMNLRETDAYREVLAEMAFPSLRWRSMRPTPASETAALADLRLVFWTL